MELSQIPKQGQWSDIADVTNDNFNKVNMAVIEGVEQSTKEAACASGYANEASQNLEEIKRQIEEMKTLPSTDPALIAKVAKNTADSQTNARSITEMSMLLEPLVTDMAAYTDRKRQRGCILGGGTWHIDNANEHLILPVEGLKTYALKGNESRTTFFAFLKTYNIAEGTTPNYSEGTTRIDLYSNTTQEGNVPGDAKWLYIQTRNGSGQNLSPAFILIDGSNGESKSVSKKAGAVGDMRNSTGATDMEYLYRIDGANNIPLFGIKKDGTPVFQKPAKDFAKHISAELLKLGILTETETFKMSDADNLKIQQFENIKAEKIQIQSVTYNATINVSTQTEFDKIPQFIQSNKAKRILITITEGRYTYTDEFIKIQDSTYSSTHITIIGMGDVKLIAGTKKTITTTEVLKYRDNYSVPYTNNYNESVCFWDGKEIINAADTESLSDAGFEKIEQVNNEGSLYKITDKLGVPDMTEAQCADLYIYIIASYYVFQSRVHHIENGIIYFEHARQEEYNETTARIPFISGGSVRYKLVNIKGTDNTKPYIYNNRIYIPYKHTELYVLDKKSFIAIVGTSSNQASVSVVDLINLKFIGGTDVIKLAFCNGLVNIESCVFEGTSACVHAYKADSIILTNSSAYNIPRYMIYSYKAKGNVNILNNYICDAGKDFYCYAIQVTAEKAWIARNTCIDCYMGAIRTGLNNHADTYGTEPIIIEYNEIAMTAKGQLKSYSKGFEDMGAIYVIGYNFSAIVRHNYIHDIAGTNYSAPCAGIYLDNGCSNAAVYKNLVLGHFNWSINSYLSVPTPLWQPKNRFIAANIVTSRIIMESTYAEQSNINAGNIICYDETKPENTYSRMENKEFFYSGCKVCEGKLYTPRKVWDAIKSAKFSNFITEKINSLYE